MFKVWRAEPFTFDILTVVWSVSSPVVLPSGEERPRVTGLTCGYWHWHCECLFLFQIQFWKKEIFLLNIWCLRYTDMSISVIRNLTFLYFERVITSLSLSLLPWKYCWALKKESVSVCGSIWFPYPRFWKDLSLIF